jgi:hypothetical protein
VVIDTLRELAPDALPGEAVPESSEIARLKGLVAELGEKNINLVKTCKEAEAKKKSLEEDAILLIGANESALVEVKRLQSSNTEKSEQLVLMQDEIWKLRTEADNFTADRAESSHAAAPSAQPIESALLDIALCVIGGEITGLTADQLNNLRG